MRPITRIVTAFAALALFATPAASASDGEHKGHSCMEKCACRTEQGDHAEAQKTPKPSAPEYPVFTDQG